MSKIPRSHLPTPLVASTPLEASKSARPACNIEPNRLKFSDSGEFSIIEKSIKPTPLKQSNSTLKRTAASFTQHLPKKQPKIVPKVVTSSARPTATDFKAKYNDVSEKHQQLQAELKDISEKFTSTSQQLSVVRNEFELNLEKNAVLTEQLQDLRSKCLESDTKLTDLSEDLNNKRRKIDELESRLKYQEAQNEDLIKQSDAITSECVELKSKLTLKTTEYDALKIILNDQMKKSMDLAGSLEEHRIKVSAQLSEITFLKMQKDLMEEKNTDCDRQIGDLRLKNEELGEKLRLTTSDKTDLVEKFERKSKEFCELSDLYDTEKKRCASMSETIDSCQSKISKYMSDLVDYKNHNDLLSSEKQNCLKRIDALTCKSEELQKIIETMFENEKVLRNQIQDLKGHIRVYCRIRPLLACELDKNALKIDILDSSSMDVEKLITNVNTNLTKKQNFKHSFTFDGIFSAGSQQIDVFHEVSTMIQSALDGYNVCIFAYGQTGSGKTYTMEGDTGTEEEGIVPRAIDMIFKSIPALKNLGWEIKVTASFFEIYNENIFDLLNSCKEQEHSIKMLDSKGSEVYVSNLREESVENADELMKLLYVSQKNRKTAATLSNERSSRSHSIAKIKFSAEHCIRKEKYVSNLNFIDLAGSESGKTSQRMEETKSINKSLAELSKVILALQSKQSHVPYRNSKLTHILMPSLGGNSKTLMLINISQLDDCYQETVNSLRFATNVNNCKNGVSKKNVTSL